MVSVFLSPIPYHLFPTSPGILALVQDVRVSTPAPTCSANLASLSNLLVRDLPSYTNRVIQRRRKLSDRLYSSILAVGKPEFTPIEILSREYPPQFPQAAPSQVFISTLERQYTGAKFDELQQFHWLFLAKTKVGWRLVNIYTRTSTPSRTSDSPISPAVESSKTSVAEGVRLWLNDCYFGKIRE